MWSTCRYCALALASCRLRLLSCCVVGVTYTLAAWQAAGCGCLAAVGGALAVWLAAGCGCSGAVRCRCYFTRWLLCWLLVAGCGCSAVVGVIYAWVASGFLCDPPTLPCQSWTWRPAPGFFMCPTRTPPCQSWTWRPGCCAGCWLWLLGCCRL